VGKFTPNSIPSKYRTILSRFQFYPVIHFFTYFFINQVIFLTSIKLNDVFFNYFDCFLILFFDLLEINFLFSILFFNNPTHSLKK